MIIKDPYVEMINLMRAHGAYGNPSTIEIGQVTNESPLTVNVQDLPLTKDNLLIADYLLPTYSRKMNIPNTTASGSTTDGSIQSISMPDATINFTNTLKKDDLLALIKIGAFYIVICKVVKP